MHTVDIVEIILTFIGKYVRINTGAFLTFAAAEIDFANDAIRMGSFEGKVK